MHNTPSRFDFDLAIIGGGSAGYAAARAAAKDNLNTVVIEGGEDVGGLCILRGCMPTKALLYAGEVLHLARHTQPWGIHARGIGFDFSKVMKRKDALIGEFAEYRRQQLTSGTFKFFRAHARFMDPFTLELTKPRVLEKPSNSKQPSHSSHSLPHKLTARNFLIATGSVLASSPLPQLDKLDCLNSDTALRLNHLPKSLLMLGGGAVAVEFAQFFARFGVHVTLIQRSEHLLHEFDTDAAQELEKVFRREGMVVYTGTKLVDARITEGKKEVRFEHAGKLLHARADEVFFALGRVPNLTSLNLESIGVELEFHRIVTDARMQTNLPHIFAAGDCAGLHEIVHIAIQQAEIAAHNIAHPDTPKRMDYRLLTEVIFTEPQIAIVGLTEKRAHVRNIPYLAASYPFGDHGKSQIMEARDGFVKLLADPENGEILGACCAGPLGGELIHEIIPVMHARMTVHDFMTLPHYHPTLAEIWTYPAEELADKIVRK